MSELVSRLLNHYWTADDHEAIRKAQLTDWIEDLVEFDPEILEKVCRNWRQDQYKKPLPSDIRALCVLEQRKRQEAPTPTNSPPVFPKRQRFEWPLPPEGYCNRNGFGCDGQYRPMLQMWKADPPLDEARK